MSSSSANLKLSTSPTGCVAFYNNHIIVVPIKHYEEHTETKRVCKRQPHFMNQTTTSMLVAIKNLAPHVCKKNTYQLVCFLIQDVLAMYPGDIWLQNLLYSQNDETADEVCRVIQIIHE